MSFRPPSRCCAAVAAALVACAFAAAPPRAAAGPPPEEEGGREGAAPPEAEEETPWAATVAGEVVPAGRVQVEAGLVYEDRSDGLKWALETPLALRLGAIERVEIRIDWSAFAAFRDDRQHEEQGIGDTRAGVKFLVAEQVDLFPSLALGGFVKIPTADEDRGLGSGETDFGVRADATTYWIPETLYTDLSFQAEWLGDDRFFRATTELLAGYDGFAPLTIYALVTWATEEEPRGRDSVVLSLGLFVFPARWFAFDVGADLPLTDEDPDWGFFIFAIALSPRLWGQ